MKLPVYIAVSESRGYSIAGLERNIGRERDEVAVAEARHHLYQRHAGDAGAHGAALEDAVLEAEDEVAAGVVPERLTGDEQRVVDDGGADLGVDIGAGDQVAAGILDGA